MAVAAVAGVLVAVLLSCTTTRRGPIALPTPDALVEASRMGFIDDVRRLLRSGVSPNPTDEHAISPLLAARAAGFEEIAELLLSHGAAGITGPNTFRSPLTRGLEEHFGPGTPGVVVLISRGRDVIFEATYGDAQLDSIPITLDTQFRIGSLTKQFTAVALLMLQQEGRLSIRDPLSRWLPDFQRSGDITLHHLLTHTSGVPNYTDAPGFFDSVSAFTTTDELIASFADEPLSFQPGTRFAYSNSGYVLLGAVIEAAAGVPYRAFLRDRIFGPAGMHDTGVHPEGISRAREAHGYAWAKEGIAPGLDWDMSRAAAAGALYSTARDLKRWNDALFGPERGALLTPESLAQALTNYRVPPTRAAEPASPTDSREIDSRKIDSRKINYGYGFGLRTIRGLEVISHAGGLHGFGSYLARVPSAEMTIVVLHNAAPSLYSVPQLAGPIIPLLLWQSMDTRHSIELEPRPDVDAYAEFVGRYRVGSLTQNVTRDGDRLYAQITGQPRHELFPRRSLEGTPPTETPFFYRVVDAQVSFVRDASGTVVELRHEQDGTEVFAPKLPPESWAAVPIEILDEYVGRYDYQGTTLTVTREGQQLRGQLDGQDRYDIHPISETEFRWIVVDAQITFVRATGTPHGVVTHAVHQQNGRILEAPRMD